MSKSSSPYKRTDGAAPFVAAVAVTASDATIIPETDSLFVGSNGNLAVEMDDGNTITLAVTTASPYHNLRVRRVLATGTTATGIVALYRRPLGT